MAAWHPVPAVFALFLFCNLAAWALSDHAWYLEKLKCLPCEVPALTADVV
jgi:hypothetical protein